MGAIDIVMNCSSLKSLFADLFHTNLKLEWYFIIIANARQSWSKNQNRKIFKIIFELNWILQHLYATFADQKVIKATQM